MSDTVKPTLNVLHVEDNSDDSTLVGLALKRHFDVQIARVETRDEMETALENGQFDLVLCDFNLPQFSAESALSLTHQKDANTPCIVISGSITEEQAVTLMEAGARDYLQKGGLQRLVPAIRREMRDARIRRERIESELAAAEARAAAHEAEKRAALADELERTNQELREAQSQLIQSAKMASLGQLVAGVAHEINNPLGFTMSHLSTVRKLAEDLAADVSASHPDGQDRRAEKLKDRLASIETGLERVRDLVQKLRIFSRRDEADFKTADLREGVESTLTLLSHRIGPNVQIELNLCSDNQLECAPGAINQVVMNLLTNAIEAIGDSGTLHISTHREGDDLVLQVTDSGPGIPKDIRERIFEPFFTTKDVGAGMGLGLAISYRIVERHGGKINCECPESGGCTFTVRLPVKGGK